MSSNSGASSKPTQRPSLGPRKSSVDLSDISNLKTLPNILHAIGNTPLVKLNKIPQSEGILCDVYVKCDFLNPGGSIKDRIAHRMIEDAEKAGRLIPGCTIIEPTSGNTGIGLALVCAVKGYKCIIVMPEKMSAEKHETMNVLGARVIRTPYRPDPNDPEGLYGTAKRLNREIPHSVILDQFSNESNPLAHYDGTAEEILQQCGGKVDMVVCGAGSGGTIAGIGRKMKEKCPDCIVVGADPEGSIFAQPAELNVTDTKAYEIEGIGDGMTVPRVLDRDVVDFWVKSNDARSFPMARRLIKEEGILVGGSCGTALDVALKAAKQLKKGQRCVVIMPDGIRNYMTKFVNDNWMEAHLMKPTVNEHSHWWWQHKAHELTVAEPFAISPKLSCGASVKYMKTHRLDQVVVKANEKIVGVVTLAMLTKKIVSQNLSMAEPVEKALFTKFQTISENTELGLVSRILEVDPFLVIEERGTVVVRADLLTFISDQEPVTKRGLSALASLLVADGTLRASRAMNWEFGDDGYLAKKDKIHKLSADYLKSC